MGGAQALHPHRAAAALSVAIAAIAALAAGCGGAGEALSRDQYVARLNAMCEDFAAREKQIGEPESAEDLAESGPQILEAFEHSIVEKVHDLEPPSEIAAQANRLVEIADRQRDVLSGVVDAAQRNDLARIPELLSRNRALNAEAGSIAHDLGADACAAR